jgi:hypothetical protein|tara:strand:+ start:5920 stop:7563 length:1644 start_codon:yes stop_codon:yes gene_type:complete
MTKKLDNKAYLGNANIKAAGVETEYTKEQIQEYALCVSDPMYFIKNYIKIVSLDEGLVQFKPYDFQENILNAVHKDRFVICKMPRQSGKSTTVISYLLHYILFNPDKNVAILANKLSTARELLGRLKLAYEHLPKWLQQGVVEWNKGSIVLENGSKILASSTSSSAVRGGSFNLLFMDEFAFVPENVADEFFNSVYPTISAGQSTKVLIVSTPKGLNMFYKLWKDAEDGQNSYTPIEVHWSDVPGRDANWKKQTIRNTSPQQFRQEFECDFLGSVNTLIAPSKLKSLHYTRPKQEREDGLKVYYEPEPEHLYFMGVDVSRGQDLDYHAVTIVDVTATPYKVVAQYKNNQLSPYLLPNLIYAMGKRYNDAYILTEVNDLGQEIVDILHNEFEYENLLVTSVRGRKGQVMDGGFGNYQTQQGVRMSPKVKKVGCTMLKEMIEQDRLVIEDFEIIQELSSFISKKGSYEAEVGHNDDLVITLVLFAWAATQNYFKDMTDINIREQLYKEKIEKMEEDLMPFGFIDTGPDGTIVEDDGTVWDISDDDRFSL